MRSYERFLEYVKIDTQSDADVQKTPSTDKQLKLTAMLEQELHSIGMQEVYADEYGYVYASIAASSGMEDKPTIGLIAHIDTATDFTGENIQPLLHENYDGKPIKLGNSGRILSPEQFVDLKACIGHTLITSDGTTLLGADDKAGVAEIMTACERIIKEEIPHCRTAICFTPDEEIGHGASLLDLVRLGADFAYTVDGDAVNKIEYETFNAASAVWDIRGVNVHPGSAKDIMINASLVAMEINSMLPQDEIPAKTEGYEGFFHLLKIDATVDSAKMNYIIRDHNAENFEKRCELMKDIEKKINLKYGEQTVSVTIKKEYRNMAEVLEKHMDIIERAERAVLATGLSPISEPVRGGTDGAQLSFRGLPCPNLGTGGAAFHGPYEHISAENMDTAVEIIINILKGV